MAADTITPRVQAVVEHIRAAIFNAEFLSGERLVELTLSQTCNVSQSTVREALAVLQQGGLVVKQARRGVFVQSFDADTADEVYVLWSMLEGYALDHIAGRLRTNAYHSLRELVNRADLTIKMGVLVDAIPLVFSFHRQLIQHAPLSQTASLVSRFLNQAQLIEVVRQMRQPRTLVEFDEQIATLRVMLDALHAGDAPTAVRAFTAQVQADRSALSYFL